MDTQIILYYSKRSATDYDRMSRKDGYLMRGSKEADIPLPLGGWKYFRLDFRGSFVPVSMVLVPGRSLAEISAATLMKQVRIPRAVLLCLFISAGLYLAVGRREKKRVSPAASGRKVYLDALRVTAAVFVVAVHVFEPVAIAIPREMMPLRLAADVLVFLFLSCNLLFVMISGALLLPQYDEPLSVFVRKRLRGVVLPFLVYTLLYVRARCYTVAAAGEWISYYFRTLISGEFSIQAPHLWQVYLLLSLYLSVIPFRYLLKKMPEIRQKQLAALILVLLALRTFCAYNGISFGISTFWGDWPGIFLLGYFLNCDWMRRYDKWLLAGGAASFAVSVWIAATRADYKSLICNQSILMTLMTSAMFVAALRADRFLAPAGRFLSSCSRYSYPVLLVHWFVLYSYVYIGFITSRKVLVQIILSYVICLAGSLLAATLIDRFVVRVLDRAAGTVVNCVKKQVITASVQNGSGRSEQK